MLSLRHSLQPFVSPAVFDFWASRISRTASWDRALAKVVARRAASRDAVTLVLEPNRRFRGFRAGQHLNVTAEVEGARLTRSYSPSSVAGQPRRIEITVREVAGGRMSRQLCRSTKIGDVLELGKAFGQMTWPIGDTTPRLLLAAGSGITPMIAMLRAARVEGASIDADLVYWARHRDDLCFLDELRALASQHAGFRLHVVLTGEAQLRAGAHAGRPSADQLDRLVPDLASRIACACGPDGFVASLRDLLATRVTRFEGESFTPPAMPVTSTGIVRVELTRSRRVLEVATGMPLLAALESQGLRPAHGCRMGLCNTCACGKTAGSTQDLNSGATDAEPTTALRICVNRAASDLILDL